MKVAYDKTTKMIGVVNEETIDMPKVLYFDFVTFKKLVYNGIDLLDEMEDEALQAWYGRSDDTDFFDFEVEYYK